VNVQVVVGGRLVGTGEPGLPTTLTIECWKGESWLPKLYAALPSSWRGLAERSLAGIRGAAPRLSRFALPAITGEAALLFDVSQREAAGRSHRVWRGEYASIAEARVRVSGAAGGSLDTSLDARFGVPQEGAIMLAAGIAGGAVQNVASFSGSAPSWVCAGHFRPAPRGKGLWDSGISGFKSGHRIQNRDWDLGQHEAWSLDLDFQIGCHGPRSPTR
jgi:hypothetical protein